MQHRTFGKTGWSVGPIGFGAWNIGGQWGEIDDATAIDTIRAGYDAGINFFDTADAYGIPPGRSEHLIGRALRDRRDKVLIATKVGNYLRRAGHPLAYSHPGHVELCCDASLHRMRLDHVDLYQCHLSQLTEPEVFLEAFDALIEKGKIRAFGISTDNIAVARAFNAHGKCTAVQLEYSLVNRRAEDELLSYCQQQNLAVIVRGPLAKGVATGKFNAETRFDDTVREGWNEGEQRGQFLEHVRMVDKLRFLETSQRTMAQAALQFVLAHPAITVAIPGAKSPEQVRANVAAADGALSEQELVRVREITGAVSRS